MNADDKLLVKLGAAFDDPMCRVTLSGLEHDDGFTPITVLDFVPETMANEFLELWKTTDYKSDGHGKITLTGLKGSYTAHYSHIMSVKIEHMTAPE